MQGFAYWVEAGEGGGKKGRGTLKNETSPPPTGKEPDPPPPPPSIEKWSSLPGNYS